jgi:ferredoxin
LIEIPFVAAIMFARLHQPSRRILRDCIKTTASSTAKRWHGGPSVGADVPTIQLKFLLPDGETHKEVSAKVGESFLQVAHRYDIDLEGACEGVCACSTCHLIFPMDVYDALEYPSEDEEDMLDMAFGLTESSRLGCQVIVQQDMDGIVVEMPRATRNFYVGELYCSQSIWFTLICSNISFVDGHVPKPH